MEINITWNVCRVCLQEQKTTENVNMEKNSLEISEGIAEQILEMTGVMIKSNDSLPQKICKKCLHVLRQAVHFRKTCRCSDSYLQDVLEKAKSATSLFKLEKPRKDAFDDIIEEPCEEFTCEEHLSEECETATENLKRKIDESIEIQPNIKKPKDATKETEISNHILTDSIDANLEHNKEATEGVNEKDLLTNLPEETLNKSNVDYGSMFLSNESHIETVGMNDSKVVSTIIDFSKTTTNSHNHENVIDDSNFLRYKTLEVSLDSVEEDVQDEILQSRNLETVDINSNNANDELFFIFADDVVNKPETNNISNRTRNQSILVENIADIVDNIVEDGDEERDFDELIDSESNTLDPIDCIDQDFVTNGRTSREGTPNNDIENYYGNDDLIESSIIQYKPQYRTQKISDNYDTIDDDTLMVKEIETKSTDYSCQICGNQFNSRTLLKHHSRTHRNDRTFECELCGKRFSAACNLTTHMRTHTGEKPFVCQYCERRFSDKSTHIKHERSHTDERPYSCTICQKSFTLSSSLKAHKRVHTGEKPFSCYTCGKSFKLPHQLKAHMATNAHKIRVEEETITPN